MTTSSCSPHHCQRDHPRKGSHTLTVICSKPSLSPRIKSRHLALTYRLLNIYWSPATHLIHLLLLSPYWLCSGHSGHLAIFKMPSMLPFQRFSQPFPCLRMFLTLIGVFPYLMHMSAQMSPKGNISLPILSNKIALSIPFHPFIVLYFFIVLTLYVNIHKLIYKCNK